MQPIRSGSPDEDEDLAWEPAWFSKGCNPGPDDRERNEILYLSHDGMWRPGLLVSEATASTPMALMRREQQSAYDKRRNPEEMEVGGQDDGGSDVEAAQNESG